MTDKRPYKLEKLSPLSKIDPRNVYVPVESPGWKRPRILTIENLAGYLTVEVADDLNVSAVDYVNQSDEPQRPPDTSRVNTRAHIAIDDNYLYVWVPSQKRWKRSLLSEW